MRRAMARAWRLSSVTTGLGVDGVQRDSLPIKMSCNQCEVCTSADYLFRAGGYAWSSTLALSLLYAQVWNGSMHEEPLLTGLL